ncbi:MAG: hypothetical protein K9L56_14270, partial [Clostridiales bacterium]|nr:hypothetical protein [Clostridiales bacterium]
MSVLHLPVLVEKLPAREKALFERIYEIDSPPGCLVPEEEMEEWVSRKFGGLEDVKKQRIMRVTNLVTGEGALFNHLRGRRPMDGQGSEDLNSLVREYREGCPFCSPEKFAPRDSFGRIRGKYCITAANLAKYDGYHGLVISNEHHPLKFNSDMVEDYFQVASRWFSEADRHAVKEGDSEPRFPFLMWNCLWPAGSSVVHGHLQLTVTRKRHYPRVEHLRNCGINYARQHGSDYYKDLFAVHRALGLGWTEEDCSLFVSLSPVKEKE